jgi:UDP-N-acetyl-D-mannosaminuronic acid dehydrogenase
MSNNYISIIGGAGHVGFPLGLAFANKNFIVNLIDLNKKNLNIIQGGNLPFYEVGAKKVLTTSLKKKKLLFSSDLSTVKKSKFIIICIGTPINKNLKPQTKKFFSFFSSLFKYVNKNQVIIIRSSVFPGIVNKIYKKYGKINSNISYCPERIVQSKALIELPNLPQVVSGITKKSIKESSELFKKICKKILISSVKEAELIKLFSNANRYINFAIANQLYLICEKYDVEFKKIRHLMRLGYERNLNLPKSGFSAGPCLLKDTMQLSAFYKGNFELGLASMKVNQSMVDLIIKKIKKVKNFKKKTIGVLGVTFKAETDDIRDSLSIELIKKIKKNKLKVIYSDIYYNDANCYETKSLIKKSDIIILGAPHKKYKKIKFPTKKTLIDIWGN